MTLLVLLVVARRAAAKAAGFGEAVAITSVAVVPQDGPELETMGCCPSQFGA
jgi:hypothetical protein